MAEEVRIGSVTQDFALRVVAPGALIFFLLAVFSPKILKLPNAEVQRELNNRLRIQGLRPVGKPLWKRLRRELRIKDHREKTGLFLIFDADTREAIGV